MSDFVRSVFGEPDLGLLVWTWISFLVVVGIVGAFGWRPILKAVEAREARVHAAVQDAQRARDEAQRLLREHEERLQNARVEAQKIIEEGKADARRLQETMLADARRQTQEMADRARREIGLAEAKARESLRQEAVDLAAGMAARVLGREVKAQDHRDLMASYVAEVERSAGKPA